MATTQDATITCGPVTEHSYDRNHEFLDLLPSSQRESRPFWTFWGTWKEALAEFWFTSTLTRACCCVDPGVHLEVQHRRRQHAAVSSALMYSLDYRGATSIIEATIMDVGETGYVMLQDTEPGAAPPTQPSPPAAASAAGVAAPASATTEPATARAGASIPVPPVEAASALAVFSPIPGMIHAHRTIAPHAIPPDTRRSMRAVKFVPRFSASVVIELRSRLGQLGNEVPGNKLIIEREAVRLMRKYKVRETDAVAHLPSIIGCYFSEDIHYRVETSLGRMSRFQRWLMSEHLATPPTFGPLA
jgi:hypothetical protein